MSSLRPTGHLFSLLYNEQGRISSKLRKVRFGYNPHKNRSIRIKQIFLVPLTASTSWSVMWLFRLVLNWS